MFISNMISLKSGNIAISCRNTVEIYDLKKLDFSGKIKVFNHKLIQKKGCLLQKIHPENRNKFVSYVYEFNGGILLCPTFSKITIIKLTDNDTKHEIISHINLSEFELSRKIISLGNEFFVALIEQNNNCNIKLFKKNNTNNIDIKDNFFEMKYNITHENELFVSIYAINKKIIDKDNYNYIYEFIATSNSTYDEGKDKIVFYGINQEKNEIEKIKEITGLSCSIEPDSICQLNDNIICVGLQNHNEKNQINGFALIDISKRELNKIIINEDPISSLYYYQEKNLLIAAMEICSDKHFKTKIYEVKEKNEASGKNEIELKKVFEYKNKTQDIIISINKVKYPNDDIIFVASTDLSRMEVVKADIVI